MSRIDRYIIAYIIQFSAIVALALTSIYLFTAFVAELDETGRGDFGMAELALYTVLNLPVGLQTLLPIVAMLGTLMGLGQLAAQNELTAIRAAGVSNLRIGLATLLGGIAFAVFGWLLGEWIAPLGTQAAERLKTETRYGEDAGSLLRPVWLREGNHMIRIGRLLAEDHVENTLIYTLDDAHRLESVSSVEEAEFVGDHWLLKRVVHTAFGADGKIEVLHLDRYDWQGALSPNVLRLFVLEAGSLSATGLVQLIDYLDANGLDSEARRLELWKKLIAPLTVVVMMVFAVPFAFGSMRSSGAGQRLLVGVIIGVCFYVGNEVTANVGLLYAWPPSLAASLPTLLLAVAGLWRLQRAR